MSFTDKEIERFLQFVKERFYPKLNANDPVDQEKARLLTEYILITEGFYDKEAKEWGRWLKNHDQRLIEEIEREVKDMTIKLGSFDEKDIANINQRSIGAIKFKDQVLQKLAEYKV